VAAIMKEWYVAPKYLCLKAKLKFVKRLDVPC